MPKWFWINKLVFLSGQKHVVCSGTPGWCAWVLALRQQPLYDRSAHSRFTICLYFIWHRDIRAKKVWVHDMIHMRRKYGELYSFTLDKKEKERQWRHQCLSENLNLNFSEWQQNKDDALGKIKKRPLLLIGSNGEKTLAQKKPTNYVDTKMSISLFFENTFCCYANDLR